MCPTIVGMDIDIIVFDGFDELDAIAPFEVLRNAEAQGADLHATVVGLHGAGEITAAHGSHEHGGQGSRQHFVERSAC